MAIHHKGRWIAAGLIVLALAIIGAVAFQRISERNAQQAKKDAEQKAPKVVALTPSDLFLVQSKVIAPQLQLSGTLEPVAQGVAKARAAGTLVGASKREGEMVRAGEVLGNVEAADLRMRVAQQESLRAQAQAQFETARKSRAMQQALLDQGFISKSAFDNTEGSYLAAKAALDAAQSQVNIASQSLRDAAIVAPIAGVISKRHVEPGERVTNEMTVYTIMQTGALEFAPQVPSEDATQLRVGMPVEIEVPGIATPLKAAISRIAPNANAATRTVDVRAKLANADGALKAGSSATGRVALGDGSPELVLPIEAVRSADAAPYVLVAESDKAVKRAVTLGTRDERTGNVVIAKGVGVGERVISARVQDIKEGQSVRIAAAGQKS